MSGSITEVNKETFWALIAQAKERCGQDQDAFHQWVEDRLVEMGLEQALNFDNIVRGYRDLAYKYGLWSAASILCDGCTDDGFIDFRGWLIAQGREVYMVALADPDSLADAADYQDQRFACLPHMGDRAYEELTGREVYEDFDPAGYNALKAELKKDIVYGQGIEYPYGWWDVPAYLPRLCAKYITPEELTQLAEGRVDTWNLSSRETKTARANAQKSKKIKKNRGDPR